MIEYAFIGDVHGNLHDLEDIVARARTQTRHLVFLGDYINRGQHSRQVVDFLLSLKDSDETECVFLGGNHDEAFLNTLDTGDIDTLLRMGGATTIASYVDKPADDVLAQLRRSVPNDHVQFFRNLSTFMSTEQIYAAHAPDPQREKQEAVGKYRIYGHVLQPSGIPLITDTQAFIDTGCGTTTAGRLTCLFWPNLEWMQSGHR